MASSSPSPSTSSSSSSVTSIRAQLVWTIRSDLYRDINTKGEVMFNIPRPFGKPATVVKFDLGQEQTTTLEFPDSISYNTPLLIQYYSLRTSVRGENTDVKRGNNGGLFTTLINGFGSSMGHDSKLEQQMYYGYSGKAIIPVASLGRKGGMDPKPNPTIDIKNSIGSTVATITIRIQKWLGPPLYINTTMDKTPYDGNLDMLTAKAIEHMKPEIKKFVKSSNIDYLDTANALFTNVNTAAGVIPMWEFCNDSYINSFSSHPNTEKLFVTLLEAAKFELSIERPTPIDSLPIPTQVELMCQMVLTPLRGLLYVLDTTPTPVGERMVDFWAMLGHLIPSGKMGYDCEDGTFLALELFYQFVNYSKSYQSTELEYLRTNIALQYQPLFTIGSINLGGESNTYHAFVLLMPRFMINDGIRSLSQSKFPATSVHAYTNMPMAMLESTNHCTSCPAYKDPDYTDSQYQMMHMFGPIEPDQLLTTGLLRRRGIYRHIVTAFAPDLITTNGTRILRIDFFHDGKHAAPTNVVMNNTASVLPYHIQVQVQDKNQNGMPSNFMDMFPIHIPWPLTPSFTCKIERETINNTIKSTPSFLFSSREPRKVLNNLGFRAVDYTPEMEREVIVKYTPKEIEKLIITLPMSIRIVILRLWG